MIGDHMHPIGGIPMVIAPASDTSFKLPKEDPVL